MGVPGALLRWQLSTLNSLPPGHASQSTRLIGSNIPGQSAAVTSSGRTGGMGTTVRSCVSSAVGMAELNKLLSTRCVPDMRLRVNMLNIYDAQWELPHSRGLACVCML
jgi:hypothetical protein